MRTDYVLTHNSKTKKMCFFYSLFSESGIQYKHFQNKYFEMPSTFFSLKIKKQLEH